ncbi:MAG: hypothetical protein A3J55_04240 [Candidatus Ryanbacteria bacterium RIFCSPHIGHO2_02_FULL_45_17b]|uniref:Putative gluconeogenesis factor n=1 Tax=Candidatus Ryanbacteria bacterium RIFCSPHIGHO2_01_FULL_45_22 TaxID=1802114 RepID=A0A1G2G1G9_9BACT|nr:MAG: hypothetical protein A2719_02375 [Candidatus Ryanbacteria bacterium RIFCSPHIGHO2_01_FULL_45_22]OGZ46482.1 MAG: hypothetical protein A3J55_04240 [Candidatus Ryanbacteria bacterium RIFCSPHIGHO2_02_FULL_45_17b]
MKKKKVVVIGGGTGTSVVLQGLKKYPVDLSAIITTADDGSSSGVLRKEFDMVPPGDIRQCLVALAAKDFGYLNERFQKGFLQGHTLGNLLITLFSQHNKDFQQAIDELLLLVGAEGSLIPMTLRPVTLSAHLTNGKILVGESRITRSRDIHKKLKKLSLSPKTAHANPRAVQVLLEADAIIVGPGNLYASIIPVLLLPEITHAMRIAYGKKIYVANLFTQSGHTPGFGVKDYLHVLERYMGGDVFTHIIYNTKRLPVSFINQHRNDIVGEEISISSQTRADARMVGRSLASSFPKKGLSMNDPLHIMRNPFLHDPVKLAKALMKILHS